MDRYPYWSYRSLKRHVDTLLHIVYKLLLLLLEILYVVCI